MARSRVKNTPSKNPTQAAVLNEAEPQHDHSAPLPHRRNGDRSRRQPEIKTLIQLRAYQLFEQRGRQHGDDLKDWLEAERLTLAEHAIEA